MTIDISDVLLNTGKVKKYTIEYGQDSFSYKNGDYRVVSSESFEIEVVSPDKNNIITLFLLFLYSFCFLYNSIA